MRYRHEQQAGELIEQLCRKEAGIMRAEKAVTKVSRDYIQYARNVAEMKNSMDRLFAREEAEAKDREDGRNEGLAEGKLEIARKMKNAGRPLSEITEFTGLPTEPIEQL